VLTATFNSHPNAAIKSAQTYNGLPLPKNKLQVKTNCFKGTDTHSTKAKLHICAGGGVVDKI